MVAGGKATAAPPLGPALGPLGINIGQVIADINKKTALFDGMQVPVKIKVDMELALKDIQEELLGDIEKCAPFGMGCPEPLFVSRDFKVQRAQVVGQKHLKLYLEGSDRYHEAIGFHMADSFQDASKIKGMIYSPSWNEWQGQRSLQLRLKTLLF